MNTACTLLISGLLLSTPMMSQDMILNGGFEQYKELPQRDGQLDALVGWFNPSADYKDNYNHGTPDYFHHDGQGQVKPPHTAMGTVFARSGKGLAGLILYTDNDPSIENFREYISIQLSSPLEVGREYVLSVHYTYGILNHYGGYSCQAMQMGLSLVAPVQSGHQPLSIDQVHHLSNTGFTDVWSAISYTFVPGDSYYYITLGNFNTDHLTNCVMSPLASSSAKFSYIFLDDISLRKMADPKNEEQLTPRIPTIAIDPLTIRSPHSRAPSWTKPSPSLPTATEIQMPSPEYGVPFIEPILIDPEIKAPILEPITERKLINIVYLLHEISRPNSVKKKHIEIPKLDRTRSEVPTLPRDTISTIEEPEYLEQPPLPSDQLSPVIDQLLGGDTIRLDVHFEKNSAKLTASYQEELDPIKFLLLNHPRRKIEISGHTNRLCSPEYCYELSRSRAKSVKDYLILEGIVADQLMVSGYGKDKPLCKTNNRSCHNKNQRVEINMLFGH